MSRPQRLILATLVALALAALFAAFIGFKHDTALVGALEAAGTVAAAGLAALAAIGSMRAAAESSATAKRSREAFARTMRPHVYPTVSRENGAVLGKVHCGEGHGAVDVTVVWMLADRGPVTERTARLEPRLPDAPADTAFAVDLQLPDTATVWDEISMVWIEYWDDKAIGHWRDSWHMGTEPHNRGTFHLTDSELVD